MPQNKETGLDALTDAIAASYLAEPRTARIGSDFLPSRDAIVEVINQLQELLFPGFFGRLKLTEENFRYHLGALLEELREDLAEQIYHCLCYDRPAGDSGNGESRAKAADLADQFLHRVADIRAMLAEDAQAAYDGDPAAKSIAEIIYCYPGYYAIMVYRLAHELLVLGVPLMPRIMSEHAHSVTGTDIHPGATVGRSFFIDHATGVVIGETTKIGSNVKIYQGVTLGALSFPKDERGRVIKGLQRHPTIEDNVTIYANATILGGNTVVGEGSTVGGNTFITSSVPPRTAIGQKTPELSVKAKRPGSKL